MRTASFLTSLVVLALLAPAPGLAEAKTPISLQKPIDCTIGEGCFIQQYFDHKRGPGAVDYTCGTAVADDGESDYDGTDFRIEDKVAQARGIAVRAAADGQVIGLRDGRPDFDVGTFDPDKVKGVECGNGVLIKHANGWETQYCHMRQGSVQVKMGDRVTAGTPLGMIGQSGEAEFMLVHMIVRHEGKPVDPFAYGVTDCDPNAGEEHFLWRAADRAELAYRGTTIITGGFTTAALDTADIERGNVAQPDAQSSALVFYGRAINLREGDTQELRLVGPDDMEISENELAAVDHNKALYMAFTGKKLTAERWPAGIYKGVYSVLRDGQTVATKTFSYVIK